MQANVTALLLAPTHARAHARPQAPTRAFFDSKALVCSTERFPRPLVFIFHKTKETEEARTGWLRFLEQAWLDGPGLCLRH